MNKSTFNNDIQVICTGRSNKFRVIARKESILNLSETTCLNLLLMKKITIESQNSIAYIKNKTIPIDSEDKRKLFLILANLF